MSWVARLSSGDELAEFDDFVRGALGQETDFLAAPDDPVSDADVGDRAAKFVVVGIEDHRLQRRLDVAAGGGDFFDDGGQQFVNAQARFCATADDVVGIGGEAGMHLFDDFVDTGVREVDLVDDGHDGQVVLHGGVGVGDGLGLDALKSVDQQQCTLATGEAAGDFVVEVDVSRGVDQIQFVGLALMDPVQGDGAGP